MPTRARARARARARKNSGWSAIFTALALSGCSLTRAAVYDPEPDLERAPPPEVAVGEAPIEDVAFAASDGTKLHGRLLREPGATRAVLFCHGTGGNVARLTNVARALRARLRAHVLVFDYRGFGRSEGSPEEAGICADARAALETLDEATGVARERTLALGHSLGGAVAIDLALEKRDLAGLAVVSTFTNLEDETRHLTGVGALVSFVPERWESLEKIPDVACPKLFVAGTDDALVPSEHAERLHAAARGRKRLVLVGGAEHEMWSHELVWRELEAFLDAVAPEPAEKGPANR